MTPYYQDDHGLTLYHGDALAVLREMPSESVDCCVTSPPYYGLRMYGKPQWEGGDPFKGISPARDPLAAVANPRSAAERNE